MSKYAILNGASQVITTIEWDGDTTKWTPPAGTTVALWTSNMVNAPAPIEEQNRATIVAQARQAIIDNLTFINMTPAVRTTNADAQILALTRQMNKLIRYDLNQFDSTT